MDAGIKMKIGTKTKIKDCEGHPIYIGDTLSFDPYEWGGENIFVLEFDEDECRLGIGFPISDLTEWCKIIKTWNNRKI